MPTVTSELLVFIASPGDCDDERSAIRKVAGSVTQAIGTQVGVRVRVEGWETIAPDFGRPQAQINRLVDECDVFIGVLGQRWGSSTGTHSSGFMEEFERAVTRRSDGDSPRIAMYFRKPSSAMLADPGPELTQVLNFQQRIKDEHLLLYRSFEDTSDLEREHLWPLLTELVIALGARGGTGGSDATSAGAAPERPTGVGPESPDLDDARRQIAATTDAVTQLVRGLSPEHPPDRDRLLLVALAFNNDGGLLPAHVANRLYRRRADLVLSVMEHSVWLRSFAADVGNSASEAARIIPGCAVVYPAESDLVELLDSDSDHVVGGVFRILLRLGRQPGALWPNEHEESGPHVQLWASALRRVGVSRIVETYLATFATRLHRPLLDAIVDVEPSDDIRQLRDLKGGDPSTMAESVSSRSYQPEWKILALAEATPDMDLDSLQVLAVGKSTPTPLRRSTALELRERGELTDEILSRLMVFPSLIDVVLGWLAIEDSGVTPERLARLVAQLDKDTPGLSNLANRIEAAMTSTEELVARLESGSGVLQAWDVLEWKEDAALYGRARDIFDEDADQLVGSLLDHPAWRDHLDIIPFVRSQCRLSALRILMRQTPIPDDDRARVRAEVERNSNYTRLESSRWLSQIATSSDLAPLLSVLPEIYGDTATELVENMVRLGGNAARRVLDVGNADQQAIAVTALARDSNTDLSEIRELLYHSVSEVRMAAVEQIIERCDKDQLEELLNSYPDADHYFYNVVCAIDWALFHDTSPPTGA